MEVTVAKKIGLTQGKYVVVDDEDFDWLNSFRWTYSNRGYAFRNSSVKLGEADNAYKRQVIYLHKFILGIGLNQMGDHISGNKLDNRRENLRIVTKQQNNHNSLGSSNSRSKYKGVVFGKNDKGKNRWRSSITLNYKKFFLGSFYTEIDAALAYDIAAIYYFGDYAKTNFPKDFPKENIKVNGVNYNYLKARKKSKYYGISLENRVRKNKWRVKFNFNKKTIHGGQYETELEAAKRYDKLALKLLGEKAKTNFKYKEDGRFVLSTRLKLQSY